MYSCDSLKELYYKHHDCEDVNYNDGCDSLKELYYKHLTQAFIFD